MRVIVIAPVRVIAVVGRRIIRSRIIITGVIRGYVRSLCTSAQKSCDDACAEQIGRASCRERLWFWFHEIIPFHLLLISLLCHDRALSSAESQPRKRQI